MTTDDAPRFVVRARRPFQRGDPTKERSLGQRDRDVQINLTDSVQLQAIK